MSGLSPYLLQTWLATAGSGFQPKPASDTIPSETASQTAGPSIPEPDETSAIADEGAILREVLTGTPASQAGLRPGDGIIELDGQPIRSAHDLTDRLDRIPARATILLIVVRDRGPRQQRISLSLRTASRPEALQRAERGSPPTPASIASASAVGLSPSAGYSSGPGGVIGSSPVERQAPIRVDAPLPVPQHSDLRLPCPARSLNVSKSLSAAAREARVFPRS